MGAIFQSSRSLRTATYCFLLGLCSLVISILAVLADRDSWCVGFPVCRDISILAVLADRDKYDLSDCLILVDISILAVLADRDCRPNCRYYCLPYFNPRGPCGPRRRQDFDCRRVIWHFNPRGPCGPRPTASGCHSAIWPFQSSRSLRTATARLLQNAGGRQNISILAVLADRDSSPWRPGPERRTYFNPRGPCGPRPCLRCLPKQNQDFNPRGPCGPRRFTKLPEQKKAEFQSSRSLRTATAARTPRPGPRPYFNPRGPCGPRQRDSPAPLSTIVFQSSRSLRTAT